MAILNRKKEKTEESGKSKQGETKSGKKKDKKKKISEALKKNSDLVNQVMLNPVVSEDAMNKTTFGKYVFRVSNKANKKEIAKAAEALYGIEVVKVNIVKYKPESHRFRMRQGTKKGYKKAIISVKSGQEIKLFNE